MALDDKLLEILVCPESKQPLIYFEEEEILLSPASRLKYAVEDDEEWVQKARDRGLEHADQPIGGPGDGEEPAD